MHKRRVGKSARRDMRAREREIVRSQELQEAQAESERQERFQVIHGGREVTPEEAALFAARIEAQQRRSSDSPDRNRYPNVVEPSSRSEYDDRNSSASADRSSVRRINQRPVDAARSGAAGSDRVSADAAHSSAADVDQESADVAHGGTGRSENASPEAHPDTSATSESGDVSGGEAAQTDAIWDDDEYIDIDQADVEAWTRAGYGYDDEAEEHPDVSATQESRDASIDETEAEAYDGNDDEPPKKAHRVRRVVLIIVGIAIAVIAILMGLFCWNRWLRYDDTVEIQGEWFAAYSGKRAPIVIDGETIEFNPETKWHYTLDTTAKTITFTFGSQSGGGRYWFIGDHEHLVIEDGLDFTAFGTFMADLQRTLTGQADVVPQGATITVLSRSADALPAIEGAFNETSSAIGGNGGLTEDAAKPKAEEDVEKPAATGDEGQREATSAEGEGAAKASEGTAKADTSAGDGESASAEGSSAAEAGEGNGAAEADGETEESHA